MQRPPTSVLVWTKPSGGETTTMEHWGMRSTSSLPFLAGPLWPGVVASDKVLSMGEIELSDHLNWSHTNDLCYFELEIEI